MTRQTYAIDLAWPVLLRQAGIRPAAVLRRAGLPDDLFARSSVQLESSEYFRFWEALEAEAGDGLLPLRLFNVVRSEAFSPPLFAALCSPNLLTALQRLAKYKTLVAPVRLDIEEDRETVTLELVWLDTRLRPPSMLATAELLFFVCLARMGTHERIEPTRVITEVPPHPAEEYEKFVGIRIRRGKRHAVTFTRDDATRPFLSANDAMWAIFEPELRRRLGELDASATTTERVRATLLEGLPGGDVAMNSVARRLALSKRTLQRRLGDEGTSYQEVLRGTRQSLALHYLERTTLPVGEISFLLGFEEPNSFYRAFGEWTGRTPETVRRAVPSPPARGTSPARPR